MELDNIPPAPINDKIKVGTLFNKVVKKSFGKYGGIMDLVSRNNTYKGAKSKTYFGMTPKQLFQEMIEAVENGKIEKMPQEKNNDIFVITLKNGIKTELQSVNGHIETFFGQAKSILDKGK